MDLYKYYSSMKMKMWKYNDRKYIVAKMAVTTRFSTNYPTVRKHSQRFWNEYCT